MIARNVVVSALAVFAASCRGELTPLHVYYVPIGAETYMAVTPDSINGERMCQFRTRDAAALREILASATPLGGDARFSPQRIRAKIVQDPSASTSVLVDNEGSLSRPDGYFRLSEPARQKLKTVIEHACKTM